VTLVEEQGRDVWRWPIVEDGLADLRYAFRQLRRTPAFAFAAIATLALGIGASVAMFTVVNAVVLRPLPFPSPDRLVTIESRDRRARSPTRCRIRHSSISVAGQQGSHEWPAFADRVSR
jgi:hypothetical protein